MKHLLCVSLFLPFLAFGQSTDTSVVVQTVASSGAPGYLDGVGVETFLSNPTKLLVTKAGEIYFWDYRNYRLRRIGLGLAVSTVAGTERPSPFSFVPSDGDSNSASFSFVEDMVQDSKGNLIVADGPPLNPYLIRRVTPQGDVQTVAGGSIPGYHDGLANRAGYTNDRFHSAYFSDVRLAIDSTDTLYLADKGNNRIRKMDKTGEISTIAGSGQDADVDGVGIFASFSQPSAIAIDLTGNLLVFDSNKGFGSFRKIDTTGKVTTRTDLQPLIDAFDIRKIDRLLIDSMGAIYFATANKIIKVAADGQITLIAGGTNSGFKDGPVASALFCSITGFDFDASGAIYVADSCNNRIRKVTTAREEIVAPAQLQIAMFPGLTITGIVGRSYRAEFTTDLPSGVWQTAGLFTMDQNPFFWLDQTATNPVKRFYRAVLLP